MLYPFDIYTQNGHSIRINDQYRICFSIDGDNNFNDVEIVDYH